MLIIGEEDLIKEEHKNWLLQKNTSEFCDLERELTVFFSRTREIPGRGGAEREKNQRSIGALFVEFQNEIDEC